MKKKAVDLTAYNLHQVVLLGAVTELLFVSALSSQKDFVVHLNDIVASFDWTRSRVLTSLRIEKKAGAFGKEISQQLDRPEAAEYMRLYIYEDAEEKKVAYRALAEKITIRYL